MAVPTSICEVSWLIQAPIEAVLVALLFSSLASLVLIVPSGDHKHPADEVIWSEDHILVKCHVEPWKIQKGSHSYKVLQLQKVTEL